ncbi:uncharacterized protein LOC124899453 [Capsicum annuum]|uniref:uncharacterized protein LOC124899453 n=1 Tax=Capsicum annuum TaxID=4072 RepID=UPI001FB18530|nr:uncharacterized protein LOC124899453 [Capsicum annuum]
MSIKFVMGGSTVNVISTYAPQVGLDEEDRKEFWEVLDKVVKSIPSTEKLFVERDFNGHIEYLPRGYDNMYFNFSFGVRNEGGASLLDFTRAFGLWIENLSFPKKEDRIITFHSSVSKTQIDFLLLRKGDQALCQDCKFIPSENLSNKHRLLVLDLVINKGKKKRSGEAQPRIKWGSLTLASTLEMEDRFKNLEEKGGDKKLYRISKARERRARDLDQVKFSKVEDSTVLVENALIREMWQSYFHKLLNDNGAEVLR